MTTGGPWMKFYPADWRSDPRLRMCSIAARGLWIEMLALMHEGEPYGHLVVSGRAPTDEQLGVLVGAPPDQIPDLLAELESAGVYSRTREGVIYSRRMVRDDKRAKHARKIGKKGGNPNLASSGHKRENAAQDNPPDNGGDKTQKPEARSQNPPCGPPTGDGDDVAGVCRRVQQSINAPTPMANVAPTVRKWLGWGCDPESDILPAIAEVMARREGKPPDSVKYFDKAVWRAREERMEAPPEAAGQHSNGAGVTGIDQAYEQWKARVRGFAERGMWFEDIWGPAPSERNCQAPADVLERHGYRQRKASGG